MSYLVFLTFSWVQIHQRSPVSQPALSDNAGWMVVSARVAHILQLQLLCPSVTGEKTTKTCSKKTSQSPSHSLATMSMILPPTPWWLWVSLGPMEGHGTSWPRKRPRLRVGWIAAASFCPTALHRAMGNTFALEEMARCCHCMHLYHGQKLGLMNFDEF